MNTMTPPRSGSILLPPASSIDSVDDYYMDQCLTLAEQGWGRARPNPMVGAVVLDTHGRKVGEGFHPQAGAPHAEPFALEQAGESARGGTLYVNLEPCNHHGKTPPCTEALIQAGIAHVVCGTLDPNPLVAGQGIQRLQDANLSVRSGIQEHRCRRLNEIFFYAMSQKRPFMILKTAMTLDGKIATRSGHSQWVTGSFARDTVHYLRAGVDAILTTTSTVMADNPSLTVRRGMNALIEVPPIRIVLDRLGRLNPDEYSVFNVHEAPTWVFTAQGREESVWAKTLLNKGVQVFSIPETGLGLDLVALVQQLGDLGLTSVLIEAGGQLAQGFLSANLVDKGYLFYGNQLLGDQDAPGGFSGAIRGHMTQSHRLKVDGLYPLGSDFLTVVYPSAPIA